MKKLPLIICIVILAGCATQKRCLEKFPPQMVHDTVTTKSIIYKDTTVYVEIPGETVIKEVPILLPMPMPEIEPVRAEVELAQAEAKLLKNKLRLTLIQKDSILEFKLDSAIRVNADTIRIKDLKIIEKPVDPKWYPFFKAGFWILGILMILTILFLVLRK
jgi:hypothetical protein